MSRLLSTRDMARHLGFASAAQFLRWANKQQQREWAKPCILKFPRPQGNHHLMWDVKAMDHYLDRIGGIYGTGEIS